MADVSFIGLVRPCFVDGEKALFHGWFNVAQMVCESILKGGHPAGIVCGVLGLVELKNGKMCEVSSQRISFPDSEAMINSFCYGTNDKE